MWQGPIQVNKIEQTIRYSLRHMFHDEQEADSISEIRATGNTTLTCMVLILTVVEARP
jgi:hypothetical protein